MCKFFSLISDGHGRIYYFADAERKKILKGELNYEPDSHTSIADYHGFKGAKEDKLNKYEYNPLTKDFVVDQLNTIDDSESVKKQCLELDFKIIVPELIIKPIIHPLKIKAKKVTKKDIADLRLWASVRDSVRTSVRASVWDSVWTSVWDSVRTSVWDSAWNPKDSVWTSVRDSVWTSVRDSVRDSVWDSVWTSVRDSVWDSVWAYHSSFYGIKYQYDFSPLIRLWERGFIPSLDGKTWRLHAGGNAKIVYEIKKEVL